MARLAAQVVTLHAHVYDAYWVCRRIPILSQNSMISSRKRIRRQTHIEPVRVVFFGTPDFVLPCLRVLVENPRYAVVGGFTQPDKPQGRGKALPSTPVKLSA